MYQNRLPLYNKLEQLLNTKLLVYVTGDRLGMESQIGQDIFDHVVDHLDLIGAVPRISLFLYTRGGHTLSAWSLVNLICQFCDEFEVIIPSKAHSAGTLISLGASRIIMTKQATLGPIDPSINTPLNPRIPDNPQISFPVSVEAINGFFELAKELDINQSSDRTTVLSALAQHVHPLVLGDVFRIRSQIRMLGSRLLKKHMTDEEAISRILDFLTSESGSHDYTIYRQEARDVLGLPVEKPDAPLYDIIKSIYNSIAAELLLTTPFQPNVILGAQQVASYHVVRGLIESVAGGSHQFVTDGELTRYMINTPNGPQPAISDNRSFEGWKHEYLPTNVR